MARRTLIIDRQQTGEFVARITRQGRPPLTLGVSRSTDTMRRLAVGLAAAGVPAIVGADVQALHGTGTQTKIASRTKGINMRARCRI